MDPSGGCDITSLIHRPTGTELLFHTPWRDHAQAVRDGISARTTYDPTASVFETYRGGWQVLFPVAGPPRPVHGAPTTFHGEAMQATWTVTEVAPDELRAQSELFSVPVRIERRIVLADAAVSVTDRLVNLSGIDLEVDYVSHPALSTAFLDGHVVIDSGASLYTADAVEEMDADGSDSVPKRSPDHMGLREVPSPGEHLARFGWLSDFDEYWASVTNLDLGLSIRLDWDGDHLPHAWFWQELNSTQDWPWYGRARVMAIEPSSRTTRAPAPGGSLRLGPSADVTIRHSLTVQHLGMAPLS